MSEFNNLQISDEDGIRIITIDREAKLNALNRETILELGSAFKTLIDDKSVYGVLLTGAGEKAFVAGADISEFTGVTEMHARKFAEEGQEVFQMIEDCSKPVVALVNGFAFSLSRAT